jgi:hypothetical protein
MYVRDMDPTKNVYMWMIHQDVCKRHGLRFSWVSCRLHTSWCIIYIYSFLVGSMSLTYILMYHPHIYVFGGVHVSYIHLDVSSTYIRFWWSPCLLHTSCCIIYIYTLLVTYICRWYIKMYVSDMEPTKNVYMWMIHQDVCKRHGPHQKRIYVDDTSRCM